MTEASAKKLNDYFLSIINNGSITPPKDLTPLLENTHVKLTLALIDSLRPYLQDPYFKEVFTESCQCKISSIPRKKSFDSSDIQHSPAILPIDEYIKVREKDSFGESLMIFALSLIGVPLTKEFRQKS